jgi:hypothetical protein
MRSLVVPDSIRDLAPPSATLPNEIPAFAGMTE